MRRPLPDPELSGTPWADVPLAEFRDWKWQLRHRIETLDELERVFVLTPREREGFQAAAARFRFATTPYYALLSRDRSDPSCPIRRQVVPRPEECETRPEELRDPLGEERLEAAPNLIHRYPDRALLLVTDRCPAYCRFCTRRRVVGKTERPAPRAAIAAALAYVRRTPALKEVILSGGDALMLADRQLAQLLAEIRSIDHVEIVRIATRAPVTSPTRVSSELAAILTDHAPVYVMTHFNHPYECTESAWHACSTLADRGIPVYNQSVLLRGINDDARIVTELNRALVAMRVTPYYLHQCDMVVGLDHFRTPLATGIEIIERMRGHASGLLVPQLCVDVPGGLGKVTVQPSWVVERRGRMTRFRTYGGATAEYIEPDEHGEQARREIPPLHVDSSLGRT